MRTSRWVLAASAAALMTLTACGEDETPGPTTEEASSGASETPSAEMPSDGSAGETPSAGTPLEPSEPEAPTDGETPPDGEGLSDGGGSPTDVPPAHGDAVDGAVTDLAGNQGVDPSEVEVVSLEEVTWSDGSLGCPEPGMAYTQALVEGMRLVLAVGDEEFHYHGADDGYLSYCADPMEPAETGDAVQ